MIWFKNNSSYKNYIECQIFHHHIAWIFISENVSNDLSSICKVQWKSKKIYVYTYLKKKGWHVTALFLLHIFFIYYWRYFYCQAEWCDRQFAFFSMISLTHDYIMPNSNYCNRLFCGLRDIRLLLLGPQLSTWIYFSPILSIIMLRMKLLINSQTLLVMWFYINDEIKPNPYW